MKKLLLTLVAFGALTFAGIAQNNRTPQTVQLSPEQRAEKQTEKVAMHLTLTDTQKSTFKKLTLERIAQNQPLKEKIKSATNKEERVKLRNQVKANNDKFYNTVNSMLTPAQQTKWAEHKKKMEANNKSSDHHD